MSDQEGPPPPGNDEGSTPPPPAAPPPAAPPPAPGSPGGAAATGAGQSADVGVRLGARVIDSILLFIVNAIISAVLIFGVVFSDMSGGNGFANFGFNIGSFIASIVFLAITFGYYVLLETSRGATVGKMLLNLEVRNRSGAYPTPEQSLRRNAFYALSIIPFLGGLLQLAAVIYIAVTISQDPNNRGWHDEFADTMVVRTP